MRAIVGSSPGSRWSWGLVVGLGLVLVCWSAQGQEGQTQGRPGDDQRAWARVTVERGRLSVDLRQADIHTVLAQIRMQTGITIVMAPMERRPISVQFSGVDLDQGLRRLLRLASLSYTIRYTTGEQGARVVQEVRVFGEGQGVASSPMATAAEQVDEIGQRFAAALLREGAAPTPTGEESEAARRFREAFERPRERGPAPPPAESEAGRLFREALEQARAHPAPPAEAEGSAAADRFYQSFERLR